MPLGMEVGLGPGDFVLGGDPAPPPREGGPSPPNFWHMFIIFIFYSYYFGPLLLFLAHVYYGQTAGLIKMILGMEIGLSPGDFALNWDPACPLNFRPMFIIVIVISLEHCTGVRRYWFVNVHVQV